MTSLGTLVVFGSDIFKQGMECVIFNIVSLKYLYIIFVPLALISSAIIIGFYGKIIHLSVMKRREEHHVASIRSSSNVDESNDRRSKSENKITKVMTQVRRDPRECQGGEPICV